jgi:diguanylate cyclase (GGDEF)-like protein
MVMQRARSATVVVATATDSFHDRLSGLPNRQLFSDRLQMALHQAARAKTLVAVVVIDLNKTTEARAALGLAAAEELTRLVSEHLQLCVRTADTLACIGADFFAIVMPQVCTLAQVLALTKRLMKLFDGPWEIAGQTLYLTPGVGIACYPESGTEVEELLAGAVSAAGHAAAEGGHLPHVVDARWHEEARRRLVLEADLRRALERGDLALHYQAQVSAETGLVSGFEALVRWQHPTRGLLAAAEFVPLAEDTHLIIPLGAWVIDEACRQLAAWRDQGLPCPRVAVNLAGAQLADGGLLRVVRNALATHGIKPERLEFEITESSAFEDEAQTARVIGRLKRLGVRITLDDYGSGYSSALMLLQYPFDTLKIDRFFVARSLNGQRDRAIMIMAAIIDLAHAAGLTVVAEGVETRAQLELLHELGADEIQGYFFSRPLAATDCEPFLRGRCDLVTGAAA